MQKYFFELKNRLFLQLFFFFFNVFFFFFYKEFLLFLIVKITYSNIVVYSTLNFNYYFIFTNVTEIFLAYYDIIFYCNWFIFCYYLLIQNFFFLGPAFFKLEYQKIFFLLKVSFFFFFFSCFISYFYVIPTTWDFFLSFQKALVQNYQNNFFFEIKLAEYINFCKNVNSYCFFYFQILTIAFFIYYQKIKIILIKKYRKICYYFLIFFVMLIGSSDLLLNQLIGFFFLIFFYEAMLLVTILKNFLKYLKIKVN